MAKKKDEATELEITGMKIVVVNGEDKMEVTYSDGSVKLMMI